MKTSIWWLRLAPIVTLLAVGEIIFSFAVSIANFAGFTGKTTDIYLFLVGAIGLPPIGIVAIRFLDRSNGSSDRANVAESLTVWAATVAATALSILPAIFFWRGETIADWQQSSRFIINWLPIVYATVLILALKTPVNGFLTSCSSWRKREIQVVASVVTFNIFIIATFQISFTNRFLYPIIEFFVLPPFANVSTIVGLKLAIIISLIVVIALPVMGWLEAKLSRLRPHVLGPIHILALLFSTIAMLILFFDPQLKTDALHYFAYLGPALHRLNGGTLLVDTFSQYGVAPVFIFYAGMLAGYENLQTANIVVQLTNFAYYGLWLACLFRMSARKIPALAFGLVGLAVMYGIWAYGTLNLNITPSVMGMRYLPNMAIVLAISCLPLGRRHSFWSIGCLLISATWSFETFLGSFGIYSCFIFLSNIRRPKTLILDMLILGLTVVVGLLTFAFYTKLSSGQFPDLIIYLNFLVSYNPVSPYWSIAASTGFYGWIMFLAVPYVVFSDAIARTILPESLLTAASDRQSFYQLVPMAALLLFQSTYFVGRSVDFTLVLAILPFFALVYLAVEGILVSSIPTRKVAVILALPAIAFIWGVSFSILSLLRANAPHEFLVHRCLTVNQCNPMTQFDLASARLRSKVSVRDGVLDPGFNWFDTQGVTQDAVLALHKFGANEPRVTVLLGDITGEGYASELALMYVGKWHTWPRSMTFSDNLVPALTARILAAPVVVHSGSLVLVRRDEKMLSRLEKGILDQLNSIGTLTELPLALVNVIAFEFNCSDKKQLCKAGSS